MCVDDVQIFASHPTLRTSRNPLAGWRALFNRGVGFGGHNPLGLFFACKAERVVKRRIFFTISGFKLSYTRLGYLVVLGRFL